VGAMFLADEIVLFLFEAPYIRGADALRVLIFAVGFDFFNVFFAVFLIAWNRKRTLAVLQIGALILNIALNGALIPHYSHVGAAMASLASKVLLFVAAFILVYKRMGRLELTPLFKGIAAAFIMGVMLWFLNMGLMLSICLSAVLYFGCLFLMGGIRMDEILVFKR
jgi:O-antigen/teichoic acid export membrane protein